MGGCDLQKRDCSEIFSQGFGGAGRPQAAAAGPYFPSLAQHRPGGLPEARAEYALWPYHLCPPRFPLRARELWSAAGGPASA